MIRSSCCVALIALLLAGCAANSSNQARSFSARDLGVEEHFPGGSLEIKEVAPDVYNAVFRSPKTNIKPSGQDALLVTVVAGMITVCPAWRLAKEKGAEAAVITQETAFDGGIKFSIFLTTAQAVKSKASQIAGGAEAADFTDPGWKSIADNACP